MAVEGDRNLWIFCPTEWLLILTSLSFILISLLRTDWSINVIDRIVAIFDQYQIVLIRSNYWSVWDRQIKTHQSQCMFDMLYEKLVFHMFLDTQIICICSTLIVNAQEPTIYHTWMVTSLPVVLSNLRFVCAIPNRWGHWSVKTIILCPISLILINCTWKWTLQDQFFWYIKLQAIYHQYIYIWLKSKALSQSVCLEW